MSDTKIYYGQNRSIGCEVENCKYHTSGDQCSATAINVESENAIRKAETFCSTFETKASN